MLCFFIFRKKRKVKSVDKNNTLLVGDATGSKIVDIQTALFLHQYRRSLETPPINRLFAYRQFFWLHLSPEKQNAAERRKKSIFFVYGSVCFLTVTADILFLQADSVA